MDVEVWNLEIKVWNVMIYGSYSRKLKSCDWKEDLETLIFWFNFQLGNWKDLWSQILRRVFIMLMSSEASVSKKLFVVYGRLFYHLIFFPYPMGMAD